MRVQVASMFRNSADYLAAYFSQILALREKMEVNLVLAEGDSDDLTYKMLGSCCTTDDILLKVDHGGARFGSVNHPVRWDQIATVMREIVTNLDPSIPTIWVESDLRWTPDTMVSLLQDIEEVPAVAPMCLADGGSRFYDIYGFRIGGKWFQSYRPWYTPELTYSDRLVKIDSCGSCFAIAPQAFPALQQWDGRWPFPADGLLWMDPALAVHHP